MPPTIATSAAMSSIYPRPSSVANVPPITPRPAFEITDVTIYRYNNYIYDQQHARVLNAYELDILYLLDSLFTIWLEKTSVYLIYSFKSSLVGSIFPSILEMKSSILGMFYNISWTLNLSPFWVVISTSLYCYSNNYSCVLMRFEIDASTRLSILWLFIYTRLLISLIVSWSYKTALAKSRCSLVKFNLGSVMEVSINSS